MKRWLLFALAPAGCALVLFGLKSGYSSKNQMDSRSNSPFSESPEVEPTESFHQVVDLSKDAFDLLCYLWESFIVDSTSRLTPRLMSPYTWSVNRLVFSTLVPTVAGFEGIVSTNPWVSERIEDFSSTSRLGNGEMAKFSCKAYIPLALRTIRSNIAIEALHNTIGLNVDPTFEDPGDFLLMTLCKLSFSAKWDRPFNSTRTEEGLFYVPGVNWEAPVPKPVQFMYGKNTLPFYSDNCVTAISLSLKGRNDLKFVLLTCKAKYNYREAWRQVLRFQFFWGIVDALNKESSLREMIVQFPKFKQECVNRCDLIEPLLRGCVDWVDSTRPLKPMAFLAKEEVGVFVNEEGLSFDSNTSYCLKGSYGGYPVFKFDCPFLYFVVDVKARIIYLIGEYLGPL